MVGPGKDFISEMIELKPRTILGECLCTVADGSAPVCLGILSGLTWQSVRK